MIDAKVYPARAQLDHDAEIAALEFTEVDFVSFVNGETYGKPAIIAPGPDHVPVSDDEVTVLYINVNAMTAAEVTKRP